MFIGSYWILFRLSDFQENIPIWKYIRYCKDIWLSTYYKDVYKEN